ncbi:hypothetical protein ILUMI_07952 [Ignelater luminosus]|uniref:Uncharacterized protein n=1 Tax=Ignelater luminosus TaxID=2038154 RepID=A0A8K0D2W3_IGNLU|nr:hypothetical protein ILUMI_07952 [Ignelater luminosus]
MIICQVSGQYWKFPKEIYDSFSWIRQGKTDNERLTTSLPLTTMTVTEIKTIGKGVTSNTRFSGTTKTSFAPKLSTVIQAIGNNITTKTTKIYSKTYEHPTTSTTLMQPETTKNTDANSMWTTVTLSTQSPTTKRIQSVHTTTTSTPAEIRTQTSTILDVTTQEITETTEEPRDNHRVHDFFLSKHGKPHVKVTSNISQVSFPLCVRTIRNINCYL